MLYLSNFSSIMWSTYHFFFFHKQFHQSYRIIYLSNVSFKVIQINNIFYKADFLSVFDLLSGTSICSFTVVLESFGWFTNCCASLSWPFWITVVTGNWLLLITVFFYMDLVEFSILKEKALIDSTSLIWLVGQ